MHKIHRHPETLRELLFWVLVGRDTTRKDVPKVGNHTQRETGVASRAAAKAWGTCLPQAPSKQ